MSGFLMALGGAMKGYGDATLDQMKADALAKREEALSQAKFERERLLAADTRQFESIEAQKQRDFTGEENDKQRALTSSEKEKDRAADTDYRTKSLDMQRQELDLKKKTSGSVMQTPDGPVYQTGDQAVPITDNKGERVKALLTDKDKPADVATMEYLIQKGVAKDYNDAWTKVKQGVKPAVEPKDLEDMVEKATKTELTGAFNVTPERAQEIRERNRARIEQNLGLNQKQDDPKAAADGAKTTKAIPAVGEERKGFRFLGGDPSEPKSWEKVK